MARERDRATHPRLGDQTACKFCGADIEYHGPPGKRELLPNRPPGQRAEIPSGGWIDRGSGTHCSPASGRYDQDGAPIKNKVQRHKPVSDRVPAIRQVGRNLSSQQFGGR